MPLKRRAYINIAPGCLLINLAIEQLNSNSCVTQYINQQLVLQG